MLEIEDNPDVGGDREYSRYWRRSRAFQVLEEIESIPGIGGDRGHFQVLEEIERFKVLELMEIKQYYTVHS